MKTSRHRASLGCKVVVGLDIVSQATSHHVVVIVARQSLPNKIPGADVCIFKTIGVVPSINKGVSYCFSKLMGNHTDSRINSYIAIG